jgi:chromate reductase
VPLKQKPEAYIGGAADLFDQNGTLKSDGTRAFLKKFVDAFAAWVETCLRK